MTSPGIVMGGIAGAAGISIAAYLQLARPFVYAKAYIVGLYLFGSMLLLLNLEHVLAGTGYWTLIQMIVYGSILAIELLVFYDLYDGNPDIIQSIRRRVKRYENGNSEP